MIERTNTSTEKTNLLGEAVRDDYGKDPIHLIPPEVFTALASVYDFGAKKYAPRNWEKGMDWSRVYSSAMRHLLAFWSGEDFDEESGLPHVWHALWNLSLLHTFEPTRCYANPYDVSFL